MALSNTKICIRQLAISISHHFGISLWKCFQAFYFEINRFHLAQRVLKDSFFIRVDSIVQIQDNLCSLVEYNCTLNEILTQIYLFPSWAAS